MLFIIFLLLKSLAYILFIFSLFCILSSLWYSSSLYILLDVFILCWILIFTCIKSTHVKEKSQSEIYILTTPIVKYSVLFLFYCDGILFCSVFCDFQSYGLFSQYFNDKNLKKQPLKYYFLDILKINYYWYKLTASREVKKVGKFTTESAVASLLL